MSRHFLAFAASTRAESLNKRLMARAVAVAEATGAHVHILDYESLQAPLYLGETAPALPAGPARLSEALRNADGLMIASPEHNWSMPASLKNLIDWLSLDPRAPLKGKRALLMCASPSVRGGILGLQQLSVPLSHLGVHVYPHLIAMGNAEEQLASATSKDHDFLRSCVADWVAC